MILCTLSFSGSPNCVGGALEDLLISLRPILSDSQSTLLRKKAAS